jgi:hypothetical protein
VNLITIEQARSQTHADGVDEAMLELYAGAAERAAMQFLNRYVYPDTSALSGAQSTVAATLQAADVAFDAAIDAADDLEGSARCAARDAACRARTTARNAAREVLDGIVVTDDIRAAVLLTLAHLYRNREDVVAGSAAAAVQLPLGAHSLLWPYRVGLGV